jgi:hypothetical protein
MTILMSQHGRGKELQDMLRKELGVPDGCRWFSVRFEVGEPVRVECEYTPEERRSRPHIPQPSDFQPEKR